MVHWGLKGILGSLISRTGSHDPGVAWPGQGCLSLHRVAWHLSPTQTSLAFTCGPVLQLDVGHLPFCSDPQPATP